MRDILYYELVKIIKDRRFVISAVLFLFAHLFVYLVSPVSLNQTFSITERQAVIRSLKMLSAEEIVNKTEELMQEEDPADTGVFSVKYRFYRELHQAAMQVRDYSQYLESIQENSRRMMRLPLFRDSAYIQKSSYETLEKYEALTGIDLVFDVYQGVQELSHEFLPTLLLILLLYFTAHTVFLPDESGEIDRLERTTRYGRKHHMAAKLLTADIAAVFFSVIFFIISFSVQASFNGIGDPGRALQSVPGFEQCPYQLTVGHYLLLSCLLKVSGALILVSFFSAVIVICRNTGLSIFTSGIVMLAELMCHQLIPEVSWVLYLKYLNLFAFLQPVGFFSDYRLFNILSVPVNAFVLSGVFLGMFFLICIFVTIYLGRQIRERQLTWNWLKSIKKKDPSKSLFLLEMHKILMTDKGLLYISVGLFLAVVFFVNYKEYLSREEAQYKAYMYALSGRIDENTMSRLKEERNRFQELHDELADILIRQTESEDDNGYWQYQGDIIQEKLQMEAAFERAAGVIDRISERPNAYVVYNTGYDELFRFFGFRQIASELLIILIIVSILIQGYFTERSSGMGQLIHSSYHGRKKLKRERVLIYELLLVGISITVHTAELINVRSTYGLNMLKAPICSLESFPLRMQVPVWTCVVLFYLIRTGILSALLFAFLIVIKKENKE